MTIQVVPGLSSPTVYYADNDDDPFDREHVANTAIQLGQINGTPGHGLPYQNIGVRALGQAVAMVWAAGGL